MKSIILFTFFLFSIPNMPSDSNQATWELAKHKDEIKVYTRVFEGSDIHEFKAVTQTLKNVSLLEKLIEDVEGYPNWQMNCAEAKILKRLENNELYVWYNIETPWPFSDRDMIVNMRKSESTAGVITYTITNTPNYISEKEDLIRIQKAKGKWQFTPKPNGETEVVYQFYADPAGNLPEWVINLFLVDGPYQTFLNLHKEIAG